MKGEIGFWFGAAGLLGALPLLHAAAVACQADPPPASPVASASSVSASAASSSAPPVPPAASSAAAAEAPDASVEATAPAPSKPVVMTPLDPIDWHTMSGRWIDLKMGDAIPGGPLGGAIVEGAVRLEFVVGRAKSKTPFNLTFWAPRPGHMGSETISGGCGFYETGTAYCRGYGLKGEKPLKTRIGMQASADRKQAYVVVEGLFDAFVVRP